MSASLSPLLSPKPCALCPALNQIATARVRGQFLVLHPYDQRMPSRFDTRVDRDYVLVAQLVDDLAHHVIALRRGARDPRGAAGPRREVRELAGERRVHGARR